MTTCSVSFWPWLAPAETPAAALTRKALQCRQDMSPRQLKESPLGQSSGDKKKAVKDNCVYIWPSYSISNMPEDSCISEDLLL